MRPGKRTVAEMVVVGAIASAVGIVAGLLIHWFPPAASSQSGPIDTLWDVLLIVSIPVFVLVATVVLYSVRLFRVRPGQELADGEPIHGNTRLEIVWTAVPSMLIAGLVVYAYLVLVDIEKAPAQPASERQVRVMAQQFAWQFQYTTPDGKQVRSDQLYLPVGESVRFNIETKDVLHDFWVPAFRMKIDAVPGIVTRYRVTPTRIGRFPAVCAELCGLGHAFMRTTAIVVSRADFDAWLAKAAAPQPAAGAGQTGAVDARKLFLDGNGTATACASCHKLADAGSTATTGPDLDQVLPGKTAAFIRESIVAPNKVIAKGYQAGVMPQDYGQTLSAAEIDALVKYLAKATAK